MRSATARGGRIAGLTLLVLTWVMDYPTLFFRVVVGAAMAGAFGATETLALVIGGLFAYFPLLRSLGGLLCGPATRLLLRHTRGARDPSEREAEQIHEALSSCLHDGLRPPRNIWVIDSADEPAAFVEGSSLFLQRDAIWSPHLVGVVAHELGHLNSIDQRISTAVRWASYPSLRAVARAFTTARVPALIWIFCFFVGIHIHLIAGGHFPRVLEPLWRWWGRRRELAADRFAASLGHGESLAAALEEQLPFDVASPWLKGRTHPYVELRIDRLRAQST